MNDDLIQARDIAMRLCDNQDARNLCLSGEWDDEVIVLAALNGIKIGRELAGAKSWTCKARSANTGPNDPQDCDWPVCGCDPYADRIIEALDERGFLVAPAPSPPRTAGKSENGGGGVSRVLVCGGRGFDDAALVERTLCDLRPAPSVIIEGGARGADKLARLWAQHYGADVETCPADWGAHGKAAGPIRNQRMLDEGKPDLVIAFPGGRGTADMVRRAKAAGVEVRAIPGIEKLKEAGW